MVFRLRRTRGAAVRGRGSWGVQPPRDPRGRSRFALSTFDHIFKRLHMSHDSTVLTPRLTLQGLRVEKVSLCDHDLGALERVERVRGPAVLLGRLGRRLLLVDGMLEQTHALFCR
jgi:hypothetical protein